MIHPMEQLRFTIPEMLSLIGVFQCIYIMVYIFFRAGKISHIILPVFYFLTLGLAFLFDFGYSYIGEITPYYDLLSWGLWFSGPPLSVLLIIQMSQITRFPSLVEWSVLLFVPAAYFFSRYAVLSQGLCSGVTNCPQMMDFLNVGGIVAGALSLLMIWGHRNLLLNIRAQKAGQERYWLVLTLIFVNIFFLVLMAFRLGIPEIGNTGNLVRTLLGLSFIYLVTTSLFRIYPQAISLSSAQRKPEGLNAEEQKIAKKIENLMSLEKVYHEPTYGRSNLAQELGHPETLVSRVINIHFGKSFPQLLNENRINDAKRLLLETDASIKIVAQEVGFNSLPSFNRVFKEQTGRSPSEYRKNMIK